MAGWIMANQKLTPGPRPAGWSNKDEIALGFTFLGQKSGLDLMQNCDLPPPLKVFSGVSPPPVEDHNQGSENEKLELLKALRLSQTRAREAERKYQVLSKERDALSNLLIKESLRLLACRNSVRLLEFQVSRLEKQYIHGSSNRREEIDDHHNTSSTWFVAMAFCMGIAGLSLAFFYCEFV